MSNDIPPDENLTGSSSVTRSQKSKSQDEKTDCLLLTPTPQRSDVKKNYTQLPRIFGNLEPSVTVDMLPMSKLNDFDCENEELGFLNIVNSSSRPFHDEPSSRDPMVETSSTTSNSSGTNEPVCTQLLTQLNTAYTHLAPDAQALFYNQENGGIPPPCIQLVVPKPPKNYGFMSWNWSVIRRACFWSLMSVFAACTVLVIGVIAAVPKACDPQVEWWQGSLFYEIHPASFRDISGITNRLNYIQNLGVKAIRLNFIFPTANHAIDYDTYTKSLTEIDKRLGSMKDFENMVLKIHEKKMKVILDLPLCSLTQNFDGAFGTENLTGLSNDEDTFFPTIDVLETLPLNAATEVVKLRANSNMNKENYTVQNHLIENSFFTKAIRFWLGKEIDGFYLKGLENCVKEKNFPNALRYWKKILGNARIFMCSEKAANNADVGLAKNVILNYVSLVDVQLNVGKGTKEIKSQIDNHLKGIFFKKSAYPWIYWSTDNSDTSKLDSHRNAVTLLKMILPGTSNIFNGEEVGLMYSKKHQVQTTLSVFQEDESENISIDSKQPSVQTSKLSNFKDILSEMSRLRSETTAIYVKAVIKKDEIVANCDVRYTLDDWIVIERWYPRRNTIVFVANLGTKSQIKDLSPLYYGGHIVVGSKDILNKDIYFKELHTPPGAAFVIKLDK